MATDLPERWCRRRADAAIFASSAMTGSPPIVLPRQSASLQAGLAKTLRFDQFAEIDGLAHLVRKLDADDVAAGHDGDARRNRRHGAGDIIGKTNDARGFDARRWLELIEGDDRSGANVDDLAAHAEVLEHAFQKIGILLEPLLRHVEALPFRRLLQQFFRGKFIGLTCRGRHNPADHGQRRDTRMVGVCTTSSRVCATRAGAPWLAAGGTVTRRVAARGSLPAEPPPRSSWPDGRPAGRPELAGLGAFDDAEQRSRIGIGRSADVDPLATAGAAGRGAGRPAAPMMEFRSGRAP